MTKIIIAAQRVERQNAAIRSAIAALKEITHHPLDTGDVGFNDEDREKIRGFISFLADKEISIEQIIEILANE